MLSPRGALDWSETDRSKALANIGLIEVDVRHQGLEKALKVTPGQMEDSKMFITAL